jgi:CRISPR system Cascade subunit CasE
MIWLSQLHLNLRSRDVRNDLRDCQALHRSIMRAFPQTDQPTPRDAFGVLYRLEQGRQGEVNLLLQSLIEPGLSLLPPAYLASPPKSKPLGNLQASLILGRKLRFRLRANPTRAIDTKTRPDGTKSNGKRVELRGEEARIEWMQRKGTQHGFHVIGCRVDAGPPDPRRISGKLDGTRQGTRLTIATTLFDGVLEIQDPKTLFESIERGIGRAKSYGQGLLSLAPLQEDGTEI